MNANLIFNPFSPIPKSEKSHTRGWALHWADMIGHADIADKTTDVTKYDSLFLDHGVNFSGGLNLFGGVDEDVFNRLEALSNFKGTMFVSLDCEMPNYVEQLQKRIGQATCDPRLESILPKLKTLFSETPVLRQSDLGTDQVTIGDSHSTSFAPKGSAVLRTNGQTLFGAIRDNLIEKQLIECRENSKLPKSVTLVYGSIDIRHHLGRQADPLAATIKLAKDYATEIHWLKKKYGISITPSAPVPVEHEGRKLPKTGYYKGTPFTGTQAQRREWTQAFINVLKDEFGSVVMPPQDWYTMDGEEYANTRMEFGGSVHLSPVYYHRNNWGG